MRCWTFEDHCHLRDRPWIARTGAAMDLEWVFRLFVLSENNELHQDSVEDQSSASSISIQHYLEISGCPDCTGRLQDINSQKPDLLAHSRVQLLASFHDRKTGGGNQCEWATQLRQYHRWEFKKTYMGSFPAVILSVAYHRLWCCQAWVLGIPPYEIHYTFSPSGHRIVSNKRSYLHMMPTTYARY